MQVSSKPRQQEGIASPRLPAPAATLARAPAPAPAPAAADERLSTARTFVRLLDSAVRIPWTHIRFGLDPLLGLVPGLGDAAGAALAG